MMKKKKKVLIIGAGPAGLSAAYKLTQNNIDVIVYEADASSVGGLSRTVQHNGFYFDIGGHRFYTRSKEVQIFWNDILGDRFLLRKRLSRIYFNKKFISYPLKLKEVLFTVEIRKTLSFLSSYISAKIRIKKKTENLEQWLINNFGKSLYRTFFKEYTEKVWGIPCHKISKDWASQRINNLSIKTILIDFTLSIIPFIAKQKIKTLITEFHYPEKGPGQFWDEVKKEIERKGGIIKNGHRVSKIDYHHKQWLLSFENKSSIESGTHLISTLPLQHLLSQLPNNNEHYIKQLIDGLKYRAFITVVLMFKLKDTFPDNWIYIHDEEVRVARIQNYKNWSPQMVPSQEFTSYGLEYFCNEGDSLWNLNENELFEMAKSEVLKIGLPFSESELSFKVIKVPKAYPVYDNNYQQRLDKIKEKIQSMPNLQIAGRNGMHRYNNQDHSITTAFLCAQNIIKNTDKYNPWNVNQDGVYLEES